VGKQKAPENQQLQAGQSGDPKPTVIRTLNETNAEMANWMKSSNSWQ
jgi:hypothetical protein